MLSTSLPGYTSLLGPLLAVAALLPSAGFLQAESPRTLQGWGQIIDPQGDCQFRSDGSRLTIGVPASRHDLSAEAGDLNAPRVLREIQGDFIAQVKVSGNVGHSGDRTSSRFYAYHGAGLLIWQDGRNYVRLERAAIHREEGVVHYVNFELRKDGRRVSSPALKIPDHEVYLRIERRGGRVGGAVSPDGATWRYLNPLSVNLPERIKLGVAAINTSTERFDPTFLELETFRKEPDRGP